MDLNNDNKMQELTNQQIYEWLKSKNYQTDYGEQGDKMYFSNDMPKIIREAINELGYTPVLPQSIQEALNSGDGVYRP